MDENLIEQELEILLKRLGKQENFPLKTHLINFSIENWVNWLFDIEENELAYPVSKFYSEGNPIIDMVLYLLKNDISTSNYEKALIEFGSSISKTNSKYLVLENILYALISINGNYSNVFLIDILNSRNNNHIKGKTAYIKSLSLIAISRLSLLHQNEKNNIINYLLMIGIKSMKHDPSFYGAILRFCYLQLDVDMFYEFLSEIIDELNRDINMHENIDPFINSLTDKLNELHYRKVSSFYKSTSLWLLNYAKNYSTKDVYENNPFFSKIIDHLMSNFKSSLFNFQYSEINPYLSKEPYYFKSLYFITSLFSRKPPLDLTIEKIAEVNVFLYFEHRNLFLPFLNNYLQNRISYVCEYLSLVPAIVKYLNDQKYSDESIIGVIDIYESALYVPWDERHGSYEEKIKDPNFISSNRMLGSTGTEFLKKLSSNDPAISN